MRIIIFILTALACNAQVKTEQPYRLSVIFTADSVLAYNGVLTAETRVQKLKPDMEAVKKLLADNKREYSHQLKVRFKIGDTGGGGKMKAAETTVQAAQLAHELDIEFEGAHLDSMEEQRFKLVSFQVETPEPMKLYLPKDKEAKLPETARKYMLTIIPADNTVHYYTKKLVSKEQIQNTTYENLRSVIRSFKKSIGDSIVILIKPAESAGYKNIVNVLDEMSVNDIKTYVMTDLDSTEEKMLGLTGFLSLPSEEDIKTPASVTTDITKSSDLTFFLNSATDLSYSIGTHSRDKATKISPLTKENILRIIDKAAKKLDKKAEDMNVTIVGDANASYAEFKTILEAFKQKELFKFQLVTSQEYDQKK